MKELEIKKVPFLGTDLMAARDNDGQIWAGVSYICKGIGLSKNEKDRQVKNVQADRVLSRGCVKFAAGVFDPNNETIAVKLDFIPLWLAKISITPTMEAETPELAEKLMEYQLKAKDVLAAALGYKNPSKALSDHCKGVTKCYAPTSSGKQEMLFIPEGDLYALLFAMQLQKANNEG